MRFPAARTLCLLALLACAPLAQAQIYRCIGAHGEPVFSGQPCGPPASTRAPGTTGPADAFGGVCPGSPAMLRQAIADAFRNRDVNLLAGLILWRGVGQGAARATLHSLSAWLQQPLAGIASVSADAPPGPADSAAPALPAGVPAIATSVAPPRVPIGFRVSTGGGDGSTREFGIAESGGCWWLTL